jgi:hypothetical protein
MNWLPHKVKVAWSGHEGKVSFGGPQSPLDRVEGIAGGVKKGSALPRDEEFGASSMPERLPVGRDGCQFFGIRCPGISVSYTEYSLGGQLCPPWLCEQLPEQELAAGVLLGLGQGLRFEMISGVWNSHFCNPVGGGFEVMADDAGLASGLPPDMS